MGMQAYLDAANVRKIPQSEQADPSQVKNAAGGFTFALDKWKRLERFLVLGTEGGTYYVDERKHTKDAITCLQECVTEDGARYVSLVVEFSVKARAIKNDTCIFALAYAVKNGDMKTRAGALDSAKQVCRIGTHWFQFAEALKALDVGWGRHVKRVFAEKFTKQDAASVIYDVIKYQQRDGWSQRDLLRLSKPAKVEGQMKEVLHWVTKGWPSIGETQHPDPQLSRIWGFERLKKAKDAKEAAKLINEFQLPRECVPTELLNHAEVWDALLTNGGHGMPITALVRNLGKMTAVGLLKPLSAASVYAHELLINETRVAKSKIHPMALFMAGKQYAFGKGLKGDLKWEPNMQIQMGLGVAFFKAFKNIQPVNKPTMYALDISGSMGSGIVGGYPVTPREVAAALALVSARTESKYMFAGFSHDFIPLPIHGEMDIGAVLRVLQSYPFGRTDCALPMLWAQANGIKVECFVIYTDNETWYGQVHPYVALEEYRKKTGINSKLIVVGMTGTMNSIANPSDAGMMDVVGFDTATPAMIADFCRD